MWITGGYMKKVKFFSGCIIFMIAWLLVSEIYVLYLENFESRFPYVTFYRPADVKQEVMLGDIKKCAEKNSLKVFLVEHNIQSLFSTTVNIYSTSDVGGYLKEKAYISPGVYKSIFLGSIKVKY